MSKVSIIVPVYNSEKYLGDCVDSLLSQTHDDLEIIIVDDCSKDKSYDVMRRIKDNNPRRIKVIRNEVNKGAAASRNVALTEAKGEYISFIDSDDYLDLNAIKKMHDSLEKTGADIARIGRKIVFKGQDVSFLGRKINVRDNGIIIPSKELEYLTEETPAVTNKMFRKELIGDRTFPENLKWEDYPYCIPLLYQANGVVPVSNVDYYYRLNPSGTTVSDARKVSPRLLDIFTCSDIIRKEVPIDKDEKLKERIDFLCIQNCLQRIRDVFYSDMPIKEKKKIISMISALIDKKYGKWQEHKLYQEYKKERKIYAARMDFIEHTYIDSEYESLETQELEYELKKVLTKKNH